MLSNAVRLWVVATPIGNASDLSPRGRDILQTADFVLAEDTRRAGLLCARCHIRARAFVSFYEHNEADRLESVLARLRQGETAALISDAGLPLVSDPGYRLVRACRDEGLRVSVAPGPCAAITALAGSGLPPQPFAFIGFLPRSLPERKARLAPFAALPLTLILFERKDRLPDTLRAAFAVLGERGVCVARELTKTHEEYIWGRLGDPAPFMEAKGEITVIVGPPEQALKTGAAEVLALIARERERGGAPRDIVRRVQAQAAGWTGKDVYALLDG
jgi:16S rRNA (cytidine1402-2'-O)-methyltransferase